MTDKEFKKLSRSELIEIIYQLQKSEQMMIEENETLREQLKFKELKISKAGSIAEAVLELNQIFTLAQKAADEYLEQIHMSSGELEEKASDIINNARKQAADILSDAQRESRRIVDEANCKADAKWSEVNRNIDLLLSSYSDSLKGGL